MIGGNGPKQGTWGTDGSLYFYDIRLILFLSKVKRKIERRLQDKIK